MGSATAQIKELAADFRLYRFIPINKLMIRNFNNFFNICLICLQLILTEYREQNICLLFTCVFYIMQIIFEFSGHCFVGHSLDESGMKP